MMANKSLITSCKTLHRNMITATQNFNHGHSLELPPNSEPIDIHILIRSTFTTTVTVTNNFCMKTQFLITINSTPAITVTTVISLAVVCPPPVPPMYCSLSPSSACLVTVSTDTSSPASAVSLLLSCSS